MTAPTLTREQLQAIADDPRIKIKPLARGKQKDSWTLSELGRAGGHFWEGAVRSSKTVVSILRWIAFVLHGPPGNLLMIGKTERTLKRNVLDVIVDLLGAARAKLTSGSGEFEICGRTIYLVGANDEGAVAKIQGMTLVGFYGDEMPTWPQSVFDMARTRLSEPGAEWFGTGNPAAKTHHLNVDWIQRAKLHLTRDGSIRRREGSDAQDVHVYSFSIYDNPWLPEPFVRALERSYTGIFYKRFILGEWCMAEGAIYDSWDADRHEVSLSQLPKIDRWIGTGTDYGTTNPFHSLLVGLGTAPPQVGGHALYVVGEYEYNSAKHLKRMTDYQYAEAYLGWLRSFPVPHSDMAGVHPENVVIDPSASSYRVQLYQMGVSSILANNEVLPGIRTMATLIDRNRFYVCRDTAPVLCDQLPGYSWDDKAAKQGDDKPIKVDDHGPDGARYLAHTTRHSYWEDVLPEMLVMDH